MPEFPKTAWELANENAWKEPDRVHAVRQTFTNCLHYSRYSYQRTVCNRGLTLLAQNNANELLHFLQEHGESMRQFPLIPRYLKELDHCMITPTVDPAVRVWCAEFSSVIENYANGYISFNEYKRHSTRMNALLQLYSDSKPSIFSGWDSRAIPPTVNCYIYGNHVQCN